MKEGLGHFKVVQNFCPDFADAEFTQYESSRTGLRVAVCDRKGPKVAGYFALATEIHDDSGAPHTLEHLVFMGSKSYKYKGVLDRLATRAYSVTNAWTATDHTAYTLDTAGWAGFAQILPIYLEHVILPTLTDSGCYTEVWHINGEGEDAGVVYSEMQGVQNNQSEIMELEARRFMYPEGNGFRYETGGLMENLRVLTADRIREFHKEMYQPKNLRVVIVGEVDHQNLLTILEKFEDGIIDDVPPIDAPFKRPWIESKPTAPLSKTIVETKEFPEEDESMGEILIGMFGPDYTDNVAGAAMEVMLTYIAGSSVSLLELTMVEKEQLCSGVYYYNETRPNTVIWFTLSAVDASKLAEVETRFFEVIRDAALKPLDMTYLRDCLHRFRRQVLYATETSNSVWYDPVIYDHLFGDREGKDLYDGTASLKHLDTIGSWSEEEWRKFMRRWFVDNHHVSILGIPSAKMSKKLKDDEKARVKAQQDRLGKDGLERLAKNLERAKEENEKKVPPEILDQFEVPSTDSIHFIPTTSARAGAAKRLGPLDNEIQKIVDKDHPKTDLFMHFEHIPTNFVHITLLMSTRAVPVELKPLIILYMSNFFTTPLLRDGKRLDFEEAMILLEKETIVYGIDLAGRLKNADLIRINIVAEREKYTTVISWLRDLLFNSIFDADRLLSTLTKILADIPDEKRSGNSMATQVDNMMHLNQNSASRSQNTLVKGVYLKRIKKTLKKDPESVFAKLERVRAAMCTFANFRVFVQADLNKLEDPASSWDALTSDLDTSGPLTPIPDRKEILSDASRKPGSLCYIVPMATIDSSFGSFTASGPDSYTHPALPALMVAMAYLEAVEGPLWVAVRGTGLAYGVSFTRNVDTGLVGFDVYRSPDLFKAFSAAKTVVDEFASGTHDFDRHDLEGAISSIVMALADGQATMTSAATQAFVNLVIKGISKDWGKDMLAKVRAVSKDEVRKAIADIVAPLFVPGSVDIIATCASIMEEKLKKDLEDAGFKPEVQQLSFFEDDYGLKNADDDNDDDDDDDDDDDEGGDDEDDVEDASNEREDDNTNGTAA